MQHLQNTDKKPVSLSYLLVRGSVSVAAIILLVLAYFSHQQYTLLQGNSFGEIEERITQEVIAEAA